MLHTTQGIVLGYIKYHETSVIVKIFTAAFGLQTYIIQGVRKKDAKYKIALFQPLTLLDMVVYHKPQRSIQRIAEAHCHRPNTDILINIKKATIAIFIAELLSKAVCEEEANEKLFHFLWQSVICLNEQVVHYECFHLIFMLQLSHYLGFGISTDQDIYKQLRLAGQHWKIDKDTQEGLHTLLANKTYGVSMPSRIIKRRITETIVKFYQLHIEALHTFNALHILQEIS